MMGIAFIAFMVWVGSILPDLIPRTPSSQTQTARAGPYQVTLSVNPNPPASTRPATLTVQITRQGTQQAINNASVVLESNMETMDMGTDRVNAQPQINGVYQARLQFSMSGPWQIHVHITAPGTAPAQVAFEVTAQ